MLGFYGLTADVTGFELDRNVIFISLLVAIFLQFVKNAKEEEEENNKSTSK